MSTISSRQAVRAGGARRLGGPACTYVGHPLVERMADLRPGAGERRPLGEGPVELLVLPGSRRSEIERLMEPFGAALGARSRSSARPVSLTLPAVSHLADEIEAATQPGPSARASCSARPRNTPPSARPMRLWLRPAPSPSSLAFAGVPMVVAYKVSKIEEQIGRLVSVPSFVLTNLVLGENVVPEFVQADCTPEKLAAALLPLLARHAGAPPAARGAGALEGLMEAGDDARATAPRASCAR